MAVYTFWEGPKPAYIDLCMRTWKVPYTVLNYDNLHEYTDLPIDKIKRFTLPQISDIVRVHVLRDQGGRWVDADTILLADEWPDTDFVGYPERRGISCAFLRTEPHTDMFQRWAKHQDDIINGWDTPTYWATFANQFPEPYLAEHPEIDISPIVDYWPETYMVSGGMPRYQKYWQFYFEQEYSLADICPTDMLMLHNSWTPDWYKALTEEEVLSASCTLSNILRELL